MATDRKTSISTILVYIALIFIALYTLAPLYLLFVNSFKSQAEIVSAPLALPSTWSFQYILSAMEQIKFVRAFFITLIITVISVSIIVLVSSLASWVLVRHKSKSSSAIFLIFTTAMLIPFQVIMFPLISFMDDIHLRNVPGLIIMYAGFGLSLSIFLYHGYIKGVPRDVEEAAVIDGANVFQLFFKIVFPLLMPINVTVIILNTMWIWNDYLLPFLVIGNTEYKTLTLELYYAKMLSGQYGSPWELVFPAVLISVIPIVILFLSLQKFIVKGISAGAVKG